MPVFLGDDRGNTLNGGVGADVMRGLGGADRMSGGFGADKLFGEAGNDSLFGGGGSDTLDGGDGDDVIKPGTNIDYDVVEASCGSDTIDFIGADAGLRYRVYYSDFSRIEMTIDATWGSVRKFVSGSSRPTYDSTDHLINLNLIDPQDGRLYISGTAGDDVYTVRRSSGPRLEFKVGAGNDTVHGDPRTFERINFSWAPQSLVDPDTDYLGLDIRITSSTATGQMTGTARTMVGAATTTRFSAVDEILGTNGNDLFIGGNGADHFRMREGDDGMDGRGGFDTVSYGSSEIVETRVDLALGEAWKVFVYDPISDHASAIRRDYNDALVNVEAVLGAAEGRDHIRGSAAANRLDGQGGDDRLEGRAGDDTLIGGDGNDRLRGDGGRDRYEFDGEDGNDRITGFQNGLDRIQITEGARRFADLSIAQLGGNVVIDFEDTTVTLVRVNRSAIDASDFLFG